MNSEVLKFISCSHEETFHFGEKLADYLTEGDVLALYGELGSGKTVFVQGVCNGLEVQNYVTSPSFTLVQEYTGRFPIFHFDFYRLESILEVEALDIDRYFSIGGISIIEWADRGESLLPDNKISIRLSLVSEHEKNEVNKRHIIMLYSELDRFETLKS
jgi:tRNA threonylcarbamoyladenosine biosynthesis protein TsaE